MRQIVNINQKWAFKKQTAQVPAAIGEDWEYVDLPHSWNAVDGQDGGNDYFRGDCMYVKTLRSADLPKAERYYLEIRGANSSAEVFVGGESLAVHHGGYSTWRVDLTDKLAEETQLAVLVNNAANETVYPQMADFTFYGGIYRDVNIVCVSDSHFDLDYYGGPGICVTPVVEGDDAVVSVETWITNPKEGQLISYTILDGEGKLVAQTDHSKIDAGLDLFPVNPTLPFRHIDADFLDHICPPLSMPLRHTCATPLPHRLSKAS